MGERAKELVTVTQAGEELGVSEATVWRLIRRGDLPTVFKGGRRLIFRRALSARTVRSPPTSVIPPLTRDHPIFRMVGAGRSGGRRPGAREKHELLSR